MFFKTAMTSNVFKVALGHSLIDKGVTIVRSGEPCESDVLESEMVAV